MTTSAQQAWNLLFEAKGSYRGEGINHEQQKYFGQLTLETGYSDKVLTLKMRATGVQGEIYHDEVTWVGPSITGELTMYVASNNHPGIALHVFHRLEEVGDAKNLVFRLGDPSDRNSFREEITLGIQSDGSMAHLYSWGMPGSDFKARSGGVMGKD